MLPELVKLGHLIAKAAIDFHPAAAVYMASLHMEMTMLEREVRKTHAQLAR